LHIQGADAVEGSGRQHEPLLDPASLACFPLEWIHSSGGK
jgi:hypothetical protein